MGARLTAVTGPAGAGKTERLLARYRRALADCPPGSALWIAPTQRAAAAVRGRLLEAALPACFAPGVETFDGFAQAVLDASAEEIRPLGRQLKRQLVCRLIDDAQAAGRLTYFAPIAQTDGLVDLVSEWISELKRLEVWPDELAAACAARPLTAKDEELIALYRAYQDALTHHQLYDAQGRFWSARALLRSGQRRPWQRLRLVVVDGFTDFTRTQHEILQILAERVEELLVSLPLEEEPTRADLFAKTSRTLDRLRERHGSLAVEALPRPSGAAWPAMTHLERMLFRGPRDARPIDQVERMEILVASHALGEVHLLGRRIKELIVTEHVPPGEIAVVFRSLSQAAPLVREVFAELGIPVAVEAAQPLGAAPALRALIALVRLHVEDWPFRQLLAVLTSNYFQPSWPEWQRPQALRATLGQIRRRQIPSGRRALLDRLARAAQPGGGNEPIQDERQAERAAQAAQALALLSRLAAALDALPEEATQSGWALAWKKLADETGLTAAIEAPGLPPTTVLDRAAWQRLEEALVAGDKLAVWLGEEPAERTAAEALRRLTELASEEPLPEPRDEVGRVRVLSAASVRALSVPVLFVAGLSEKAFPPPEREDRLYSEAEARQLIEAGLPLVDRTQRTQDEMLLFYEVVTRPSRRLFLSYASLDQAAQPVCPSSFLVEVERACGEGRIPHSAQLDLRPVPPSPTPWGPADLRIKAVAEALEGRCGMLAGLVASPPATGLTDNLLAALRLIDARATFGTYGPFEGMLLGAAARRLLAERFGPRHLWSASRLELYATCPHRFFLQEVLGLRELEDIALRVDYLARGRLLHEAVSELHRRMNQAAQQPAPPADEAAEWAGALLAIVDELIAGQAPGDPLQAALREVDRRVIAGWAAAYRQQHADYDEQFRDLTEPPRPAHFEVRFGPRAEHADTPEDPISTDQPLVLQVQGEEIQLTGRIDRIDVGWVGGQLIFNVIDYKTSRRVTLRPGDIEAGTALQLPLYAMAAEMLLLADRQALAWASAYWFVRDGGVGKPLELGQLDGDLAVPSPAWLDVQKKIATRVGELVRGIRSGEFPMHSLDPDCTGHCPYSTVCRVNHTRALEKTWTPPQGSAER